MDFFPVIYLKKESEHGKLFQHKIIREHLENISKKFPISENEKKPPHFRRKNVGIPSKFQSDDLLTMWNKFNILHRIELISPLMLADKTNDISRLKIMLYVSARTCIWPTLDLFKMNGIRIHLFNLRPFTIHSQHNFFTLWEYQCFKMFQMFRALQKWRDFHSIIFWVLSIAYSLTIPK